MNREVTPVGAHELRHVTLLKRDDLVWDEGLARWRVVTSALHYTTERTRQPMVKIVLDLSTFHRHAADEDARYAVLLDERPDATVRPLSLTERRRATRRGGRDEVADETAGTPDAPAAPPAGPAAGLAAPARLTVTAGRPAESARAATGRSVPDADVRTRREALRLSRGALAERAGITPGALWRVEDGRPKSDELGRVTAALDAEEARRAAR